MDIFTQLYSLYPELEEEYRNNVRLFTVRDDINGDGPYIDEWNHPTLVKPTQEQIPVYRDYRIATERLSQYILLEGREEVRETIVIRTEEVFNEETGEIETNEITEEVITQTAIEPLEEFVEVTEFNEETMESTIVQIRNPLVVKDEEERTTAQLIVDNTPEAVKESYSSVLNPDRVIVQESEGPVNPIDVLE